jgi:VWFA-related protein
VKAVYLVLGATLTMTGVVGAQAPLRNSDTPSQVFRTGVDLVALNVVVTDADQNFVTGLNMENFAVYEDGVQQELSFFAAREVPLDLALLLDTSASMSDKMQTMQEAAVGFASTARPGDRVTIVDVKDSVRVLHPLDADPAGAIAAIRQTSARGGTALYNGLYMTIKEMVKQRSLNGEVRRQAIAVFSDGDDTASLVDFDDVMEVAKQSNIAVYTITLKSAYVLRSAMATSGSRYFSQSEFAMKALAQETGARAFFPTAITELAGVYSSIAEELATQYAIGYTSKNPKRDGAYRRVVVRVLEQPGARTRTRSGYQAARAERVVTTQ